MNDEYIKREAVIKGFTDLLQKPGDIYPTDITTMMQRISAEEVRPVVRGEWIHQYEDGHGFWVGTCNQCNKENRMDNFCPNCGADMRGE